MKVIMPWVALAFAVACAKSPTPGDETTAAATLVGPRWRLVELEGQPSLAGGGAREPHVIFSRAEGVDRVGGATGCNSIGGRYAVGGETIEFSELFSTRMACVEEERMRQETRFVNALEQADRYTITGDTLILRAGDSVVARFVKG